MILYRKDMKHESQAEKSCRQGELDLQRPNSSSNGKKKRRDLNTRKVVLTRSTHALLVCDVIWAATSSPVLLNREVFCLFFAANRSLAE